MKTRKIKSFVTGEVKEVETKVIGSHDLLQEGGYEFAVDSEYCESNDENDDLEYGEGVREGVWVWDEDEEDVIVHEYYKDGRKQHLQIVNSTYTREFHNCDIWVEIV